MEKNQLEIRAKIQRTKTSMFGVNGSKFVEVSGVKLCAVTDITSSRRHKV